MSHPLRRTTVRDLDRVLLDAPAEPKRPRGVRFRVALAKVPIPARVWAFSVFLALRGRAVLEVLDGRALIATPITRCPWPVGSPAGFFLAETKVVEVNFRRETHSLSLGEIPAVVGFFFLSPADSWARCSSGRSPPWSSSPRQSPARRSCSTSSNFAGITGVVALVVFHRPRPRSTADRARRLVRRVRRDGVASGARAR